jgi:hypothetical protein
MNRAIRVPLACALALAGAGAAQADTTTPGVGRFSVVLE